MTTVNELILDAALEARIRDAGSDAWEASRSNHALRILNRMLGSWANDDFLIYGETAEDFTLTASQEEYSIGKDGTPDLDTVRPQKILTGSFVSNAASDIDYPLAVKTFQEYNLIRLKDTGGRPRWIAYNPTYPNGTLKIWYSPDTNWTLHLVSLKEITAFESIDTTVSLPPGYEDLIVQSMGARLSVSYGKAIRPDLILLAKEAFDGIVRRNAASRVSPAVTDAGAMFGGYSYVDIHSGPFE